MDIYNGDYIEEVGTKQGWPAEYLRKNRETTDIQRRFSSGGQAGARLTFGPTRGPIIRARRNSSPTWSARQTPRRRSSANSEAARRLAGPRVGSIATGRGRLIAGAAIRSTTSYAKKVDALSSKEAVRCPPVIYLQVHMFHLVCGTYQVQTGIGRRGSPPH